MVKEKACFQPVAAPDGPKVRWWGVGEKEEERGNEGKRREKTTRAGKTERSTRGSERKERIKAREEKGKEWKERREKGDIKQGRGYQSRPWC